MNKPFNASYVDHRADAVSLLMSSGTTLNRVLDIGCATGEVGAYVKRETGATVDAVEMMPDMAAVAATKLDNVFAGTAEEFIEKSDPALRYARSCWPTCWSIPPTLGRCSLSSVAASRLPVWL